MPPRRRLSALEEIQQGYAAEQLRLERREARLAEQVQTASMGPSTGRNARRLQRRQAELNRVQQEAAQNQQILAQAMGPGYGRTPAPARPPGTDAVRVGGYLRRRPGRDIWGNLLSPEEAEAVAAEEEEVRRSPEGSMQLFGPQVAPHLEGQEPIAGDDGRPTRVRRRKRDIQEQAAGASEVEMTGPTASQVPGTTGRPPDIPVKNIFSRTAREDGEVALDLDKNLRKMLLTLTALGGVVTATTVLFADYGHELMNAANASSNTVEGLSSLASGFADLTGINTTTESLVAFERAQRQVASGILYGIKPTREQIIAYGRLGLAIGDSVELNEDLYQNLTQMTMGERERIASLTNLSPAVLAAINDGLTWNEVQQAGIVYTEEEARALRETDREFAQLRRSLEQIGKTIAIEFGPALEVVASWLGNIAENSDGIVRAFRAWAPSILAVAVGLGTMITLLRMAAIAQSAWAIASVVGAKFGISALAVLGIGTAISAGVGVAGYFAGDALNDQINELLDASREQGKNITQDEVKDAVADANKEEEDPSKGPISGEAARRISRVRREEPARGLPREEPEPIKRLDPKLPQDMTPQEFADYTSIRQHKQEVLGFGYDKIPVDEPPGPLLGIESPDWLKEQIDLTQKNYNFMRLDHGMDDWEPTGWMKGVSDFFGGIFSAPTVPDMGFAPPAQAQPTALTVPDMAFAPQPEAAAPIVPRLDFTFPEPQPAPRDTAADTSPEGGMAVTININVGANAEQAETARMIAAEVRASMRAYQNAARL